MTVATSSLKSWARLKKKIGMTEFYIKFSPAIGKQPVQGVPTDSWDRLQCTHGPCEDKLFG